MRYSLLVFLNVCHVRFKILLDLALQILKADLLRSSIFLASFERFGVEVFIDGVAFLHVFINFEVVISKRIDSA